MKKGALCLFLITIKAPQSLLTPKVLKSHQKDEKAVITGGSVSLRLGSLMQQGKNKNVQGRDGCEMGVGWGGKLCSMTTSSELGKCSSVHPTVWPRAHGHRASYITALDAQTCAFLAGSHRFTYYYLGGISGGIQQRADIGVEVLQLERCPVCAHRAGWGHLRASAEFDFLQSSLPCYLCTATILSCCL